MNKKNKQKGITLIALIITIIVMLILVAVAITVAVNGGLFGYAERAGAKTNEAIRKEQELASGDIIEYYLNRSQAVVALNEYSEDLLNDDGVLTENTKYESGYNIAVIPKGFYLSEEPEEQSIENGLVIKDITDNEYVWVPVEDGTLDREAWFIDNMTGSEFVTKMNNGDYTGDELIEYLATYYATNVNYDCNATVEESLVNYGIIDSVEDTYDIEDLKAYIAYSYFSGDVESEDAIKTELTEFCTLSTDTYTETLATELVASVAKYKGFYIARYEAGSEDPRTSVGKDTLTEVITKQGLYPYNFVSQTNAVAKIGEMYSDKNTYGVVATLPYGAQWDETMKFVKTEKDVTNSTAWGNYKNNTFNFTGEYTETPNDADSWDDDETEKPAGSSWLLTTGASDRNKAKNIYDLAGNVWEWTMEAYSSTYRVLRGGNSNGSGGFYPASNRYEYRYPSNSYYYLGFRPSLYIK